MNAVVPLSESRPSLVAGGRPMAIVPQTMDEAYRLGKAICMAGMAPKGMDTPEKCMIAIMRGMEVGLTPMQALDKIAVVNGRPTIWGDGAMALVRGSGLCEFVDESMSGDADQRAATCVVKRRGEAKPVQRTFSVADARKANLWGKSGPWQQFPDRMLQMRARAFALRDVFADVLGGLYLREEIEDERAAPPRAPDPLRIEHRPTETAAAGPASAAQDAVEALPDEASTASDDIVDPYALLEDLMESLSAARTAEQVEQIYVDCDYESLLSEFDGFVANARAIKTEHLERVGSQEALAPAAEDGQTAVDTQVPAQTIEQYDAQVRHIADTWDDPAAIRNWIQRTTTIRDDLAPAGTHKANRDAWRDALMGRIRQLGRT